MTHGRSAPSRQPDGEEPQRQSDGYFQDNRGGRRTTQGEQEHIDCGRHDCFFLSLRTRSISFLSAASSSSVQEASATRAVIICPSEPPKKVCRYCCSAVRLATAGEMVAE